MTSSLDIEAHGLSHVGKVREDNQDALRCDVPDVSESQQGYLYAVADGMGGYEHGGIASALALETFVQITRSATGDLPSALRKAVQDANLRVYQKSLQLGVRMGTTLTGVYMLGAALHIAHVGDSRAYLIRDGKPSLLTNDHTRVGEMVRARVLSPDKARTHSQRSVLNRCLGLEMFVQPDIMRIAVRSGDVIILCSDGLWSVVEDHEIATIADAHASAETISQHLIDCALDHDSDDNISAWTICVRSLPEAAPERRRVWSISALLKGRSNNNT